MSDYECPYCGAEHDYTNDEPFQQDETWDQECPSCEKSFRMRGWYTENYDTWKADCLNGAQHNFEQMAGYPKEWFIGKFRCKDCGKEEERGGHYWPEMRATP